MFLKVGQLSKEHHLFWHIIIHALHYLEWNWKKQQQMYKVLDQYFECLYVICVNSICVVKYLTCDLRESYKYVSPCYIK